MKQAVNTKHWFKYAAIAYLLTACAPGLEKKPTQPDTASIKQIEFRMGPVKQASLKFGEELPAQINKNLSDWGYPMAAKQSQNISHTLTAEIGLTEHTETPTGFSFSSGNSDPRSLEFQKANVIPISCELASIATPEKTAYLKLGFAVDDLVTGQMKMSENKWVDHISTVCFNLLSELNWPERQSLPSNSKPGWIPEVRIETVPASTNTPTTQSKDTVIREDTGRKQIIIHNQGTPLILHLGHER